MEFVERKPDHAYLDTHLWIPQLRSSPAHIRAALTFQGTGEPLRAWDLSPHHLRVPRNFLSPEALARLPFPVIDCRVRDFPRVKLKSNIVLDAQDPSQTYQRDGAAALLRTDDGILCMRCGAGKTPTALHAAAQLNVPILVITPDKGVADQWVDEACKAFGITPADVGRIDGEYPNDKWKKDPTRWRKPITVAVMKSIVYAVREGSMPEGMSRYFGVVIGDEAHVLAAPFFNAAVPVFHGRRWGLSATPIREDQYDPLLRYTFGGIVFEYLTPELTPVVLFRQMTTKLDMKNPAEVAEITSVLKEPHRMKIHGFLARRRPKRTSDIVMDIRTALQMGREVLVLTHSRDQLDALHAYFPDAGVVHAGVKNRLEVIRTKNPVFAIIQLGKQALNKPKLDTLFLLEPTRKHGVLQQIFGRILRLKAGKFRPVVVVYEDVFIPILAKICAGMRKTLNKWPAKQGGRIRHKVVTNGISGGNTTGNVGRGVHPVSSARVQGGIAADLRQRE